MTAAEPAELRPAWCLLAAPAAGALVLVALSRLGTSGIVASDVVRAIVVVTTAVVGAAIGVRRRSDRLGPILLVAALLGGALMVADSIARDDGSAAAAAATRVAVGLVIACGVHLLVSLPDGRLRTPGQRAFVVGTYVVLAVIGLASPHDGVHVAFWPLVLAGMSALAMGVVVANFTYRHALPVDRRRMQWTGWSIAVWAELILAVGAVHLMTERPPQLAPWFLAGAVLVPLALAAGTHAATLARVDRLLTQTVSLAGLTTLVIAVYLAVVVALGRSLHDGERSLLLLSMGASALAALAFLPARQRLTDMANQVVYGERVAPDEALRTFGSRLSRTIPLDELLLQMVESLRKSMSLTAAECWTGDGGRFEVAAAVPHHERPTLRLGEQELSVVSHVGVSGGSWLGIWLPDLVEPAKRSSTRVAPIVHLGKLLGLIVVTRTAGEDFTEEDDRVLTELARQVGLALHNAQLDLALQASFDELRRANTDLVESRRRIVSAGDAERRKLERNLHDGAQQYLVAMAVKLRLVEDLVEEEPDEALTIVGELRSNMQDAIAELRALAHGIFPPLLSSGGLAQALPAAATRAALPTTVDAETTGRYDPEVEASVYFCCIEALQNAGKHAGDGATAVVHLAEEDGVLQFEVVDDGAGFVVNGAAPAGHGFVNMTDRLGAIGGRLVVVSAPGSGTKVRGEIPVAHTNGAV